MTERFIGRTGALLKPISINIAAQTVSAAGNALVAAPLLLNCAALETGGIVVVRQIVIHETKTGGASLPQVRFVFCSQTFSQTINTALAADPEDVIAVADAKTTYVSWGDNAIMTSPQTALVKCADATRSLHVVPLALASGTIGDLIVDFYLENN